jgi:hypothetical protein
MPETKWDEERNNDTNNNNLNTTNTARPGGGWMDGWVGGEGKAKATNEGKNR